MKLQMNDCKQMYVYLGIQIVQELCVTNMYMVYYTMVYYTIFRISILKMNISSIDFYTSFHEVEFSRPE